MSSLMWLFLIPLGFSGVLFYLPFLSKKHLKVISVIVSFIPLLLLLTNHWNGASVKYNWLPAIGAQFYLHVDGVSLVFLYLVAIIIPISLLSVRTYTLTHPRAFYGLVLLLQALLIGFFTARDLFLFTLFWEAMLIPLYFLINIWGGPERKKASLKFLIYMIAGSTLMVAAILSLYLTAGSFDLTALAPIAATGPYAGWIAAVFLLAFAVKTPLFPFHAWLPDAYTEASVPGTILLSAVLSKAGIYGFLRIGMELFPTYMQMWSPILLVLAIVGVIYGGLAAWMQLDFKRLIAYSSFSHVNFILAGMFVWSGISHTGAILQAFNHGITIAALFLVAGWLEERLRSTSIEQASGLARWMPHLCWLTLVFVLSSVALPGTNNFVGEILIFFGLFQYNPWLTAVLGLTIILSVIYMLRWMQKMYFEVPSVRQEAWQDIHWKEFAIALPLVALIFWIGIYPAPILKQIQPAIEESVHESHVD